MRFRNENYLYRFTSYSRFSPISSASGLSEGPEGDIFQIIRCYSRFSSRYAQETDPRAEVRKARNEPARFHLRGFHGPSYIRCKNYIWSICIYMYTQKHAHTETDTYTTLARRAYALRAYRACKRTAYVCTIIVSRR